MNYHSLKTPKQGYVDISLKKLSPLVNSSYSARLITTSLRLFHSINAEPKYLDEVPLQLVN